MRRSFIILVISCFSFLMFLQVGCEQQVKEKDKSLKVEEPKEKEVSKQTSEIKATGAGPQIEFEGLMYDFGKVAPNSSNVYGFKFSNIGDEILKITSVTKTCGCTPFTLEKKDYAPGESGELKVKYNAGSSAGMVTRNLFVYSNDKDDEKIQLTLKAEIVEKVTHSPQRLNLSLKEENAGCPDIVIESLDGKEFSIKRFKSTADCITADFDPSVSATKFVLKPKVDVEKLKRGLSGRIDISLTHPECNTKTISFEALQRFKSTPPSIIAFNSEPNVPIKRDIYILSNYNDDFEIESVRSEKGFIEVLSQQKDGKRYMIEIQINPPAVEKNESFFKDVLLVNIKNGETLTVMCRGFYAKEKLE
ncbi:MAG TPA: DUF1573 domain-containing protein [Sedimentisphaerales bacterium]|nr:DUF1573 domain-containing protein [Sedimentisphaerales bacterium]